VEFDALSSFTSSSSTWDWYKIEQILGLDANLLGLKTIK